MLGDNYSKDEVRVALTDWTHSVEVHANSNDLYSGAELDARTGALFDESAVLLLVVLPVA